MRKPYVRKMPADWWLRYSPYTYFMLREFTAIFIGAYCIELLVLVSKIRAGQDELERFLTALASPFSLALHLVGLAFVLYHTFTAWNAIPKILVLRMGEEPISPRLLVAGQYAAWIVVSLLMIVLVVL